VVIFPVGRYCEPAHLIVLHTPAKLKRADTNIGIFQTSYEHPAPEALKDPRSSRIPGRCPERKYLTGAKININLSREHNCENRGAAFREPYGTIRHFNRRFSSHNE
jgi:hypothetical protein